MKIDKDDIKLLGLIAFWAIILTFILVAVSGCKTVYVDRPEYHEIHDTIIKKEVVEKEVIKEVTVRDSVSFLVKGDTVFKERWHWERDYRYEKALQAKIDSLTKLKRDSIPYPVPGPTQYIEKPLKSWQKGLIWWGVICTLALIIYIYIKVRLPKNAKFFS